MQLTLTILNERYGICRMDIDATIPAWLLAAPFFSITRTPDEMSVVCIESAIPDEVDCNRGWRCFKVKGPLDFSLTGVLASITRPLSSANIPVFSLSTYDTDYLLVPEEQLAPATTALSAEGFDVRRETG